MLNWKIVLNFLKFKLEIAFSSRDIPVCNTRIVRGRHGMPWNEKIAVHPLENGNVSLLPVKSQEVSEIE